MKIIILLILTIFIAGMDCKGRRGVDGVTGPSGFDGVNGSNGVAGLPGTNGNDGGKGDQGANGKDGNQGGKGDQGDTGGKGDQGDTGSQGGTGATGGKGRDGAPGGHVHHIRTDFAGIYQRKTITSGVGMQITLSVLQGGTPRPILFFVHVGHPDYNQLDAMASRTNITVRLNEHYELIELR